MKSRLVSITGATGFFGGHIAEAFQRAGWRVRGLARPGRGRPLPGGIDRAEARLERAALAAAFAGSDIVVHAAAVARARSRAALDAVNVDGTRAVVEAANDVGATLILISSQAAAGAGTAEHPSREDDPPRPVTAYGRSKLAQEETVRRHARVPWAILRPCAIYGPRDRQFLPLFRMAERGRFLLAARAGTMFTLVDVRDASAAVVAAAENGRSHGRTYFVGHAAPVTAESVLQALAAVTEQAPTLTRVPSAALWIAAMAGEAAWRLQLVPLIDRARLAELRAEGFVCSVDRIRDELGFTAETPLQEGLAHTRRWYRAEGWV